MKNIKILLITCLACTLLCNCKEKPISPYTNGQLCIHFEHCYNHAPLELNTTLCSNEAGNEYYITEIKYFISNICLYKNGEKHLIGTHYIDTDYPATLEWVPNISLNDGKYDSIGIIFGLNERENYDFRYVNPPESNMAWPIVLGGGYHYMMLNGKYHNDTAWLPMNIHMGRGQIYKGEEFNTDSIVGYVPNYFELTFPANIYIQQGKQTDISLIMEVENWFSRPYTYNILRWGSHIMQNQTAMQILKENGKYNVFSIKTKD